ncbi:restriction endonuclease subunit S [Streptococcus suis]|uniref:restriction endonuclease subunit S n=1 Tax=Streptococcus suis TaxID=1307 RepID=UPI00240E201B|nr:restriction endonuclease subunit S [Streptococcus suis]WFA75677.1 restriction endonuclease subunit S [Streptococcus suis]WFA76640.1 restriction endonuclease subunit S [Streptococcus suis]
MKLTKITELASIERSSGKVYPAGCILIQISATNGQVLYHAEETEVPAKYAVVNANDKVLPKYLYHMISFQADAFFHAIQTGLNIQMDTLNEMKLKIHTDLEKQAEIVRYLDVIEKMEASEEATIELLKQAKQTSLSEMFV